MPCEKWEWEDSSHGSGGRNFLPDLCAKPLRFCFFVSVLFFSPLIPIAQASLSLIGHLCKRLCNVAENCDLLSK